MSDSTEPAGVAAIDADLVAGQTVGEYVVENKLGQGGFGAVFKANHPLIGKVVAIKVLARKFSVDPEMVSRFIAEAKAVNQIRNRHIIDIFSFGKLDDGRQYYVMEYLDGEPLDALLERDGVLKLETALPILRAIAKALDAAHSKGITHRDLKPENVFLGRDDDGMYFPKLLDFGIAKLVDSEEAQKHKTRTGIPIGTPHYMSPEQCRGKDVDHRTDYYAFGVVAYRMFTGVFPIDAEDYMEILMRQMTFEPSAPSTINAELPPGIDEAVAWLMRKDPSQRPPNLVTAVRAMETTAEDSGFSIPKAASVTDRGATPVMRNRVAGSTPTPPPSSRSMTVPGNAGMAATSLGDQLAAANGKRTGLWIALGLGGAALAGVIAFAATRGGGDKPAALPVAGGSADHAAAPPPPPPANDAAQVTAVTVDAAPAESQTVIVTVAGAPEGTTVSVGGKAVGVAPGPVQLPRGAAISVLTFTADGYLPISKTLTPDQDQPLQVQLKRRGGGAGQGGQKPGKDDIIDVFGKKP